jgi:hypothetical protein
VVIPVNRIAFVCLAGLLLSFTIGCSGGVKEETIQVPKQDPMNRAKSLLQNYASGSPLSSEVESYDEIVAEVKTADSAKGKILEEGLADIKKNPNQAKTKAKALLAKLDLDEK